MKIYKDPLLQRLALDHERMRALNDNTELISFELINPHRSLPPEHYKITYKVKSITSINQDKSPNYGVEHVAEIKLPASYPAVPPICYMKSDVWHPNIRSTGSYKGRICINNKAIGFWQTLDILVIQIGEMLQYKNYHALHIAPFPEDPIVAEWVRTFAEPNGIIDLSKNISIDNRSLMKPTEKWISTRNKSNKITIVSVKQKNKEKIKIKPSNESSLNLNGNNE